MFRGSVISAMAALLSGCVIVADVDTDWDWGAGHWEKRDHDFSDVNRIEFSARGTLYILQGERNALHLEGHGDSLNQLRIEEGGGVLTISQDQDNFRWFEVRGGSRDPVYTLEVAEIDQLVHCGHGTIQVAPLSSPNLKIISAEHAKTYVHSINGREVSIDVGTHALVKVETLDADRLNIRASDHSDVLITDAHVLDLDITTQDHAQLTIAGQADSLNANLLDHGDADAADLTSAIATIKASDQAKGSFDVINEFNLDERDHAKVKIHRTGSGSE